MKRLSYLSSILYFVVFFMCLGISAEAQSSQQEKSLDQDMYKAMS